MTAPPVTFFSQLTRVLNAGQSRSVLLHGNVHDLFPLEEDDGATEYEPLVPFLAKKCDVPGYTVLVYELNGPIRARSPEDTEALRRAWVAWKSGVEETDVVLRSLADRGEQLAREALEAEFDRHVHEAIGKPTVALEFLRQLFLCSRSTSPSGRPYLDSNLFLIVEAADLLLPAGDGDVTRLSTGDRRRVSIVSDWFSDPGFMAAEDSVVLLAESQSLVHPRVSRLPQKIAIEVPSPTRDERRAYIEQFMAAPPRGGDAPTIEGSVDTLATFTAGLSIHALRQLLLGASFGERTLDRAHVIEAVERFIASQLGEDVVEFKKPEHTLDDVVGFARLKEFFGRELLDRFRSTGADALPGAAVAGPIGGGKTFIFEAVAGALDLPVLVLKNIRSQWFGQTDVIFERLRRVLMALDKVVLFVDEADTQFGGVGAGTHSTERRLTGKIQQMMSDPRLRGRVVWLLMTARIHLLSPDIRRPGRVGDLIIPVLDPEGEDRRAFLRWVLGKVTDKEVDEATLARLDELTPGYSAAAFASLRSQLAARAGRDGTLDLPAIEEMIHDHLAPDIGQTRRYQTLQALVNCTRRSLLPDPTVDDEARGAWRDEIRRLELLGIS